MDIIFGREINNHLLKYLPFYSLISYADNNFAKDLEN